MAVVMPFRGIHYDLARVGDLSKVVAPPYDVITPSMRTVPARWAVQVRIGSEVPGVR